MSLKAYNKSILVFMNSLSMYFSSLSKLRLIWYKRVAVFIHIIRIYYIYYTYIQAIILYKGPQSKVFFPILCNDLFFLSFRQWAVCFINSVSSHCPLARVRWPSVMATSPFQTILVTRRTCTVSSVSICLSAHVPLHVSVAVASWAQYGCGSHLKGVVQPKVTFY